MPFEAIVAAYQAVLRQKLERSRETFEKRIVEEFAARWAQNPPKYFRRYGMEASRETIAVELRALAGSIFDNAIEFDPPVVKILYKNVAPENLQNGEFLKRLKAIMIKRPVPRQIIDSLFETGQAAPEKGAFL